MSLKWKLLLLVLGLSTVFTVGSHLVQQSMIVSEFGRLELREARANVDRCRYALDRDAEYLASFATDYGAWDDTYRFVEDRNEGYVADNLIPETFKNLRLNFLGIFRGDGNPVWAELRESGGGEALDAGEITGMLARADHPLLKHNNPDSVASGILLTSRGPMLFGASAITTSNRDGAVRGATVFGRFLDADAIAELSRRTGVALRILKPESLEPSERALAAGLKSQDVVSNSNDAKTLHSFATITDLFGEPVLVMRTDLPRVISERAAITVRNSLMASIARSVLVLSLLWIALSQMVLAPLARLTRHAVHVGQTGDLRVRLNERRSDELGTLAREFDRMVDQLAESRAQMVDVAHHAGKAQVATSVLHSVGNVLNSVTVSAGVLRDSLRASEAPTVGKAAALIRQHDSDLAAFLTNDERGRELPRFLEQLGEQLSAEHEAMACEVATLSRSVEHIRAIVQEQQQHSVATPLVEPASPAQLVRDAIAMSADSFERHAIRVTCHDEFATEALLDRHRVLQIVVNLLTNAKRAVVEHNGSERCIDVLVRAADADGRRRLAIDVQDNGVGIPAENIERIFAMGFSTRGPGHGIGLHTSANLAREMGGTLSARSDGPGHGAVFTLTLPLSEVGAAA